MRLFLFVLTAVSIYAAMHGAVLWGVHPLLAGRALLPRVVLPWMGLMLVAPLAVRLLEAAGQELAARALASALNLALQPADAWPASQRRELADLAERVWNRVGWGKGEKKAAKQAKLVRLRQG
ncbi:MAG: hypothetical protein ACYDA8_11190 [Deferrisomatales bacterium]